MQSKYIHKFDKNEIKMPKRKNFFQYRKRRKDISVIYFVKFNRNFLIKNIISLLIFEEKLYRDCSRKLSIGSDTIQPQFSNALRSARESLPSVDSAVDSWGELGEGGSTIPEILRIWDTVSVDSGQLDLSIPSYPGYLLINLQ